jgi:succinate-semialdehyde dehydrogenase/glutarate-semialdehyde dehydrogenase
LELLTARVGDRALSLKLETRRPVGESKAADVAYAAEFPHWFAEEAVRIDGRFAVTPDR